MGAQLDPKHGCSSGYATSLWQRPSTDNGGSWNHHSQIVNASHVQLGMALWAPAQKKAFLFFTSGAPGCAQPRALVIESEVADPWPGKDLGRWPWDEMPRWSAATDLTASLSKAGASIIRFGPGGAGVVLPSGDLLVCGVEGAGGVAKGIVCIASTDARAWAVRGRVPLPGATGVALTAVSGAVVIAAHTPTGLFTAMSSSSAAGASFSEPRRVMPLSADACTGGLATLPNGAIALVHGSPPQLQLSLSHTQGRSFEKTSAAFWDTGSGCGSVAALGGDRVGVFFEQVGSLTAHGSRHADPKCEGENCAAARLLFTMASTNNGSRPNPSPPPLPKDLEPVPFKVPVKAPRRLPSELPVLSRVEPAGQTDAYKPWICLLPSGEMLMSYAARKKTLLVIRRSSTGGASWGPEEPVRNFD